MQTRNISVSTAPIKTLEDLIFYDKAFFKTADFMHCDVMDGVFVNNYMLDFPTLQAYSKKALLPLDIHLMTVDLLGKYIDYINLKPAILTVHYETFETKERLVEVLKLIKNHNIKAGICVKPQTPISEIEDVIKYADMLLILGVEPGLGGQKFIEATYNKITDAMNMKKRLNRNDLIVEVDGGINSENSAKIFDMGVNILVSGHYIFVSNDKIKAIKILKR